MPPDQQYNKNYYQYEVLWLYNWFQEDQEDNNMNIFFLMNGNILININTNLYSYSPASEPYTWNCGWLGYDSAYATPPAPPGNISTAAGEQYSHNHT